MLSKLTTRFYHDKCLHIVLDWVEVSLSTDVKKEACGQIKLAEN